MKYKVGDKVRIVSNWGKGCHENSDGKMDKWLGKVMTIMCVDCNRKCYKMIETFIKPMIYNKNRPGSAEQIAGGTYKNFDYYVLNLHTCPTAYVDVTDSPLNEVFYVDIDISCHGGFTYSASSLKTVDKKDWFIGWDYAHYGDYVCGAETYSNYYDKKWTTEEIVEECKM